MNAVPSTPTYTDSLLEHKKLKDDIAALKAQKDIDKRECEIYSQTKTAVLKELAIYGFVPDLKDRVLENKNLVLSKSIESKQEEESGLDIKLGSIKEKIKKQEEEKETNATKLRETTDAISKINSELALVTERLNVLKREESDTQTNEAEKLKTILGQQKEAQERIDALNTEYSTKVAVLSEGERRLAERGSDLAIYETRLRKACLELYPEMEIILSNYE